MKLSEYILLPREERQGHVDLNTFCILNGGSRPTKASRGRRALLDLLGIENDVPSWVKAKIQICHSCESHSKNGWCENPLHLSIGTVKENASDIPLEVLQERSRKGGRKAGKGTAELKVGIHDPEVREETYRRMRKTIEVTRVDTGEVTVFEGLAVAARALGLEHGHLSQVCLGKRKHHRGFTARYL